MHKLNETQTSATIFPKTREAIPTPNRLVTNGQVAWGTFETALPDINLLESKEPLILPAPKFFLKFRLKEWQAFQIDSKDFFVLGAIYQTGLCAFNIISLWDKSANTLTSWQDYVPAHKLTMATTLLNSINRLKTSKSEMCIKNNLSEGRCHLEGAFKPTKNSESPISFDFKLTSCSEPSVMSMPLGYNRGLYTHKELFEVSGGLKIKDKVYRCTSGDLAIIDDHKGFYPYRLHYDWVTGFQRAEDGSTIAFNLTKNQVIRPEAYNENWLWVNGKRLALPPVTIIHISESVWHIKDAYGYVDLKMQIEQNMHIKQQFIVASVNYRAVYGKFNGVLKDAAGKVYELKEVFGMGEDKNYRI